MGSRALRNVGRRGGVLIALGLLWILQGLGELAPDPAIPGWDSLIVNQLPDGVRAGLYFASGLVAIAYAFVPPRRRDWPGFMALYVMPAIKGVSYFFGWLDSLDGVGGFSRGLIAAVGTVIYMAVLVIISGWKEPTGEDPR